MKSSTKKPLAKPKKPRRDYPLYLHASGRIAKKIRNKVHYFGRWATRQAGELVRVDDLPGAFAEAERQFDHQKEALFAGRTPPRLDDEAARVKDLANAFLNHYRERREATAAREAKGPAAIVEGNGGGLKRLTQSAFDECKRTCDRLVRVLGAETPIDELRFEDFDRVYRSIAQQNKSPHGIGVEVGRVLTIIKWGVARKLIPNKIYWDSQSFRRPSKVELREYRDAREELHGLRMFQPDEVHRILPACNAHLKAFVLLGLNAGFGNTDCATIPQSCLDLDGGWATYPRPKTLERRRCWLWPETCDAIREAIQANGEPQDPVNARLVFVTPDGQQWSRKAISKALYQRLKTLDRQAAREAEKRGEQPPAPLYRKGRNFYSFRRTFATIASGSLDQVATNYIMGHVTQGTESVYRVAIDDDRLRRVSEFVRDWLFAPTTKSAQ